MILLRKGVYPYEYMDDLMKKNFQIKVIFTVV